LGNYKADFLEEILVLHKLYCQRKLYIYSEVRKWLYPNVDIPIQEQGKDDPMIR